MDNANRNLTSSSDSSHHIQYESESVTTENDDDKASDYDDDFVDTESNNPQNFDESDLHDTIQKSPILSVDNNDNNGIDFLLRFF